MKEQILPEGFNGTFYFTNFTNEEFKATWNKKEYTFPKESTVPLIILDATPAEVQNIRKKFAKELAEREFFKSKKYADLDAMNPRQTQSTFRTAVGYSMDELNVFIKRCLEPLPVADLKVHNIVNDFEDKLHKDEKGNPTSPVVEAGTNLVSGSGTPV